MKNIDEKGIDKVHSGMLEEYKKYFSDVKLPGKAELNIPPNVAFELGVKFLNYEKGKSLTGKFIVQENL